MKSHEEYVKQLKEINPDITIIGRYTKARETIKSSPDWVPATFEEYFNAYYRKAA